MWSMKLSYSKYFSVLATLAVCYEGVKAQYAFRDFLYSFTNNIAYNINNWQHVHYGNGVGSNIPSSKIEFTYSDINTAGDNCFTKGVSGICTLSHKCPEIERDIREGIVPNVCSYQSHEPIVCCPKRNTQLSQQPLSTDSKNQFFQGSSTNQVNNQFIQVAQGNNAVFAAPPRETQVNRNTDGHRRSGQKCDEYSKLVTHSVSYGSLSILSTAQEVSLPSCTNPVGLIVGGEIAKVGEFPHMAAIGWTKNGVTDWNCGGSLISELFVLTAGHCTALYGISPDTVRLGDQNLARNDDNADPRDFQIASIIVYPEYRFSSNYNDIALLKLNRIVAFTKFIRPACLWQTNYINYTQTIATGWGQIEYAGAKSEDLQKVSLNIVDNNHCNQLYESSRRLRNGIVSTQMCAGFLEGGKDTCQGDSGGPIQVVTPKNQCIFHIIGVTSFGIGCAAANSAGVYTRVSSYLDWIESNVWP